MSQSGEFIMRNNMATLTPARTFSLSLDSSFHGYFVFLDHEAS